ncbi:hypothetical protein UlMin_035598 [Ulmus minor]
MATSRPKDHNTTSVGKEKRLNTTKSSTTTSSKPSTNKVASSSSSSSQVPNYLRPTISSRPESFKYVKKNGNGGEDSSPKPSLNRRKSLEKPPSPSQLQKALEIGPREKNVALRSSSFSGKTNVPTRPFSERNSKAPKAVKPGQQVYVKTGKKSFDSSPSSIKKEPSAKALKRNDDHVIESSSQNNCEEIVKQEEDALNKEALVDEELVNQKNDEEVKDIPQEDEQIEHVHDDHDVVDEAKDIKDDQEEEEKLKPCDISTVSEQLVKEEANDHSTNEETNDQENPKDEHDQGEENHNKDEGIDQISHEEEKGILDSDDQTKDDEESEEKDIKENVGIAIEEENKNNEAENKDKEGVCEEGNAKGSNVSKDGEEEEAESVKVEEQKAEEVEASSSAVMAKKQGGGQGKKESQAYNDVIEETASKLLEKRKNKVRALVGAFETVIDYESK